MLLRQSRPPWRDGYWLADCPPETQRFRRLSFGERLRAIPANTRPIHLLYVTWWMFLVLYLLARYLIALYMTCNTFSVTRGVPLQVPPAAVSTADLAALGSGVPIKSLRGAVVVDPSRDRLHVLAIRRDRSLRLDGEPVSLSELSDRVRAMHPSNAATGLFFVVHPEPGLSYQAVLDVLEILAQRRLVDPFHALELLLVSDSSYPSYRGPDAGRAEQRPGR